MKRILYSVPLSGSTDFLLEGGLDGDSGSRHLEGVLGVAHLSQSNGVVVLIGDGQGIQHIALARGHGDGHSGVLGRRAVGGLHSAVFRSGDGDAIAGGSGAGTAVIGDNHGVLMFESSSQENKSHRNRPSESAHMPQDIPQHHKKSALKHGFFQSYASPLSETDTRSD